MCAERFLQAQASQRQRGVCGSSRERDQIGSEPLTYEEKLEIVRSPGNGFANGDIYWVDAEILASLKPDSMP